MRIGLVVIGFAALLSLALPAPAFGAPPKTGRVWLYGNFTAVLNPNWSVTAMPGTRFELLRSNADARQRYMDELFVGPTFHHRSGAFGLRLSLWYYATGMSDAAKDRYYQTHSVELIPTIECRVGDWAFSSRTIFHNTVWASVYETDPLRRGYGLVIREMVQARRKVSDVVALQAAVEPFVGLRQDAEAKPDMRGYWPTGLRLVRFYAGADFKLTKSLSVTPQYVIEPAFVDGDVKEWGNYLFLTASYVYAR